MSKDISIYDYQLLGDNDVVMQEGFKVNSRRLMEVIEAVKHHPNIKTCKYTLINDTPPSTAIMTF